MAGRRQLRSRVFGLAASYAAMLLTITFVLTWRAREGQAAAARLVATDVRAAMLLVDIARAQNAHQLQWKQAILGNELPRTYEIVRQLGESPVLRNPEHHVLRLRLTQYLEAEREVRARWASLSTQRRTRVAAALEERSREVVRESLIMADEHEKRIEREMPALERKADAMMWIGLAIAWIIGIISFAVARLTLAKVVAPIENLGRAAELIASGNLEARASVTGDREIAGLAEAFNRMADSLLESDRKLRERARTDELTGLPNFRAFRERIDGEIARAARYGHPFGFLVLDLDRFKSYNDRFGHLAGNEALQAVSREIREQLRTVDFPARYGGEEFAVICPEIDQEGVAATAERIRAAVAAIPPFEGRPQITISIGGAMYPADGSTAESLFAAADTRLYQAKDRGRNCVVVGDGKVLRSVQAS